MAAQDGDPFAVDQLSDLGTWLGEGIASLAAVLDPATEYMGNRLMVSTSEGTEEKQSEFGSQVQFDREIDHLSQAILNGTEVLTPGEMGLRDVRLIRAIYQSAAETGRWIELNEDGSARS